MILVADAAPYGIWDIQFHQNCGLMEVDKWEERRGNLPLSLSEAPDRVDWAISSSGTFTVRTTYRVLFSGPSFTCTSPLWKAPMPLKINIFVWQILRDRLPFGMEAAPWAR